MFHRSHNKYLSMIRSKIKDVEHWRVYTDGRKPSHVAVLVFLDGRCYVGWSSCNNGLSLSGKYHPECDDSTKYDHSIGYRMAVGRALKSAAANQDFDFLVDTELSKRELRLECQKQYAAM